MPVEYEGSKQRADLIAGMAERLKEKGNKKPAAGAGLLQTRNRTIGTISIANASPGYLPGAFCWRCTSRL